VLQLANYAFPFLIGRIRTGKGELILVEGRMFPFLIGRIRTKEMDFQTLLKSEVSIPHR